MPCTVKPYPMGMGGVDVKRWSVILAVIMGALIIGTGLHMPAMLYPETARTFPRETPPPWQGILQIWHVNGWNVPNSTRTSCLELAAAQMEKRFPGTVVEVCNMDQRTYLSRCAAGETPDMLCFPGGMDIFGKSGMMELTLPDGMNGCFVRAAECMGDGIWALPWMGNLSVILRNAENASDTAYAEGNAWNAISAESAACSLTNALPLVLLGDPGLQYTENDRQAWDAFALREKTVLLGSLWDHAAMERRMRAGRGFAWETQVLPPDVPALLSLQWLTIPQCSDPGKRVILCSLLDEMYSENVQERICETLGAIPAMSGCHDDRRTDILAECIRRCESGKICMIRPGCHADAACVAGAAAGDGAMQMRLSVAVECWDSRSAEAGE